VGVARFRAVPQRQTHPYGHSDHCTSTDADFGKDATIEIDPRLTIELPKSRFGSAKGYVPVEGPTETEKNKVVYLIGTIIVVIIVVALILVLI